MKRSFFNKVFLIIIITAITTNAQSFGFGCLGLSGFFGGYGVQNYKLDGLNESIALRYNTFPEISKDLKFEKSTGFRFGANLLRANFNTVFLTAKAFYQFSKENKAANYTLGNTETDFDLELTSNHWGIGLDFGFPVFSIVDLKLVEGGVTFYQIEYKEKITVNENNTAEEVYKNDGIDVGYYVGTGLILNLVEGYISVEGTATYHFLNIDKIDNSDGGSYPLSSINKSFIEKGGFAAAVQLNIGFPL